MIWNVLFYLAILSNTYMAAKIPDNIFIYLAINAIIAINLFKKK